MHVATIHRAMQWAGLELPPGRYWLEDHNAAELLWASRGFGDVTLEAAEAPEPLPLGRHSHICVVRVGGFGDLLWLNSIYQELHRRGISITHVCFPQYSPVLHGFAEGILSYPFAEGGWQETPVYWMENLIEEKACLDGEHPCDRMARFFGIEPPARKAAYALAESEAEWARGQFPRSARRRVAVQMASSSPHKNYPHMDRVLPMLHGEGCELVIVDSPRSNQETTPPGVYDCTQRRLSIRESIAMAATCDVVLAPDSTMVHVAHALDIPVVGLFGPFDGASYMRHYRGRWIQGRHSCSPCHWHPRGLPFPPDGPCAAEFRECNALANVPPEYVARQVLRLLRDAEQPEPHSTLNAQ